MATRKATATPDVPQPVRTHSLHLPFFPDGCVTISQGVNVVDLATGIGCVSDLIENLGNLISRNSGDAENLGHTVSFLASFVRDAATAIEVEAKA